VGALVVLGAVIFGVSELPVAPVAPATTPIPITTKGKLVRQIELLNYPNAQDGWAVVPTRPYWRVVRSRDGGSRWQDVTPPGAASIGGLSLTVTGASTAAVVFLAYQYIRDSTFAFTSDGGADWTAGILPDSASSGPDPIYVLSSRRIFAVLGNGTVISSDDAGATWADVTLPEMAAGSCQPTSVWFTSDSSGWVTGSCTGVAALWHTSDAGQSWAPEILSSGYAGTAAVSVAPPQVTPSGGAFTTAVATGSSTESLRVFDDSSGSWVSAPAVALPAGRLLVSFEDSSHGWVLDAPSSAGAVALAYSTANEGANWSLRTTPIPAGQVTQLDLTSPEHAVALAQAGRERILWSTDDAGVRWTQEPLVIFNGPEPRVNGITG
jgi:WD40 repeat protein